MVVLHNYKNWQVLFIMVKADTGNAVNESFVKRPHLTRERDGVWVEPPCALPYALQLKLFQAFDQSLGHLFHLPGHLGQVPGFLDKILGAGVDPFN